LATPEFVAWLGARGYFVALLVFLPIYLLGLELVPKSLFRRFPYRALAALAEPLRVADTLLAPMHFVGWQLSRVLLGHHPPEQRKLFVAREDFKYLTIESERTGTLTRTERQMIHNVVDFRTLLTRDLMTPMARVQTIRAGESIEDLLAKRKGSRADRWPVVGADGRVTGLIDIFDVALDDRRRGSIEAFQRRIIRADEGEPAYAVLRKLRAARAKLAIVRGADGQDVGIVTSEALIQRLVGVGTESKAA
jgi:CBS domain containing-hemolysin-like protein